MRRTWAYLLLATLLVVLPISSASGAPSEVETAPCPVSVPIPNPIELVLRILGLLELEGSNPTAPPVLVTEEIASPGTVDEGEIGPDIDPNG